MFGHLGLILGYLGTILVELGAIWGQSWGVLGPSWKLENGVFAREVCNKWEVDDVKLRLL